MTTIAKPLGRKVLPKAGQVSPTIKQQEPYWVSPLGPRQMWALKLSIIPWIVGAIIFVAWWLSPKHHTNLAGSIVGTLICFLDVLIPGYFYYFIRRLKIVNPSLRPKPEWRVAIIVTKAPSEPWDVVKRNLIAMLNQDIPHDTWLADERPTKETLEWCLVNKVHVSTREACSEYHRTEWPRRTRCKEGNLAYFYDHYGYEKYDFVAQLDADHIPNPDYLRRIITPFLDDRVGYVAAPSICGNNAKKSWAARGRLYAEATMHGPLQTGYNGGWAPLCIGSHYAVRTEALRDIGGLGPELAEDHSTTLIMNSKGWTGVFEPYAIANGDGPDTFLDCMTQEFQWSRSLMMILCEWTPKYLGGLSFRKKFQFLFSQVWYSLFSMIALVGYSLPLICLILDKPLLNMSYVTFIILITVVGALNLLPIYFIKRYGLLRPQDAPIVSWESQLFILTRFPWVFFGIVNGVFSVATKQKLDFLVTPKGKREHIPFPIKTLLPYASVSLLSSLGVIFFHNVKHAVGYYFLALISSAIMITVIILITFLHYAESGKSLNRDIIAASFLSIALLPFAFLGSALRLPQAMLEINGSNQGKVDNADKILNSSKLTDKCKKQPCFGYYDYDRTLKNAIVHSDIGHHFISWGKKDSTKLGEALRQDKLSNRQSMITLEPWPWAVLSSSPPGNYKQREAHANKDLLKDIAKGKYDKELIASLGKISEQKNRVVYLRLMHEMDLEGQYPWSPSDPNDFINAYRHVVELSRYLKVSNIRWVWSPSGNLRSFFFWPGRDYVDYVGMSLFATPEWNGGLAAKGANLSFSQLLANKYWLSIYQKPIIIAEVGINAPSDEKVSWLKQAQKDLRYFPAVVAWIYFNQQQPPIVDLGIGLPDWGLKEAEAKSLKSILGK